MHTVGLLPVLSAGLLSFTVLAYIVLDGTDLGVGILFALERRDEDRDVMANSIIPIWDGNETWLVLGGGGLLALFPLAYSVFLTALYPTIIAMLLSLIFRGVSLEYRHSAPARARRRWDLGFLAGSVLAAFCQGVTLGALVQGIRVVHGSYAGGWWDWLSGFSLTCGLALVLGYGLLGACWLIWRSGGALRERARRRAGKLGAATLVMIGVVSAWTPLLNPMFRHRWFDWPNIAFVSPVPILVAVMAIWFWRSLAARRDLAPLAAALGWFVLAYAGLGISLYPLVVPPALSFEQTAAAPSSQLFVLVGAAVLVPIILAYNTYAFWVFRGKVQRGAIATD